ncbi:MAG: triphosphoribosyl-dephospho-CoA synthase [Aromatoleum sp.]|uniref:triphosphoribosyl-dephospho-CoA synthase n=1 Tax=Aromatoleum sp. TaxID=2307007 RepID=UPI002895A5E9|nr:triphosphoribosyl-dephospho-CoA synthase [Aromatoleum sp.]MDT3672133.1 triphosphoribosyl-dephospho-CoA synthase [Aromatoleum sp.]
MDTIDRRLALGQDAFLWACGLDVAVRKPGNVSRASPGHGMTADTFIASARAAAGPLFERGRPVGERIEAAVAASWAAAGCNTNLGIVLLCAPLAAALERVPEGEPVGGEQRRGNGVDGVRANDEGFIDGTALRAAVSAVVAALDVADARAAYRGIALANPGGLGRAQTQDVAEGPTIDLRAAMTLAAGRDSIARQYAHAYADIFDCGIAALQPRKGAPRRVAATVQAVFLSFLAGWPDSHIVRKLGSAAAQTVTGDAALWLARVGADGAAGDSAAFAAWDEGLKAAGINPGTSADLTVCTLFAAALASPSMIGREASESWHGSCVHPVGTGPVPASGSGGVPFGVPG